MGARSFLQSAGFLRIVGSKNPLDGSSVHPEAYPVVEKISKKTGRSIASMIGDRAFLSKLNPADYADGTFGVPTVKDILKELEKPGRDPRPEFKTATFKEGVQKLSDLKEGMSLEGVVTNVTAFGAFVDVGVHQDGLVHISQLADSFVENPRDVVKAGDIVQVRVLDVDVDRKRIGLSMKREIDAQRKPGESHTPQRREKNSGMHREKSSPVSKSNVTDSPFAALQALKR